MAPSCIRSRSSTPCPAKSRASWATSQSKPSVSRLGSAPPLVSSRASRLLSLGRASSSCQYSLRGSPEAKAPGRAPRRASSASRASRSPAAPGPPWGSLDTSSPTPRAVRVKAASRAPSSSTAPSMAKNRSAGMTLPRGRLSIIRCQPGSSHSNSKSIPMVLPPPAPEATPPGIPPAPCWLPGSSFSQRPASPPAEPAPWKFPIAPRCPPESDRRRRPSRNAF